MQSAQSSVLLISDDAARCSAFRAALLRSRPGCRVSLVASFAAARHAVGTMSPDVIVLEAAALHSAATGSRPAPPADAVSLLAGYAPVVILGATEPPAGLAALLAAGAAEFVPGDEAASSVAIACVQRRLRSSLRLATLSEEAAPRPVSGELSRETFGELLRHELNNPLTGILGNAELLLAETRTRKGAAISESGAKRLETIAALAVRMRETVRRLSQVCDPQRDAEDPERTQRQSSDLPPVAVPRKR